MLWELSSERPVYLQLIEQIQHSIITGVYQPGDKLPSVRDMAAEAGVNPNTMQKSLMELERSGLVYTNRTSGRYITSDNTLIKELKNQSVKGQIMEFLDKMAMLGFKEEEIMNLVAEALASRN
ncbi:MAG: GntR family transcriptional regulator [Anaerocolumna sp.]|jgi:DNA-binding transcriptional regulator YhcF (GntR family)|nr:GntR family transcriptional regulator [Anaerocolumna sp.]